MSAAFIGIDWGSTNRRAFLVSADGAVLDRAEDNRGILSVLPEEYVHNVTSYRAQWGKLPVLAAGMVGSANGWCDAGYVAAPAALDDLARAMLRLDPDIAIVPGVSLRTDKRADAMHGEEVQVLGAIAGGFAPMNAVFCQPGTHNKWIRAEAGRIVDFTTVMTGELFGLLRKSGLLAPLLAGPVTDGEAFRRGLDRGWGATDLTAALFEARARVLLGSLDAVDAASFVSGMLIGADVGGRAPDQRREVHLLAQGALADLYAAAIAHDGGWTIAIDSQAAFVAGLHQLRELSR